LVLHLEICQQSRLWGHFHGLLWKRASHYQYPVKAVLSTAQLVRTGSMSTLAICAKRETLLLPG